MIYVFKRGDGFIGADFSREFCKRNGAIIAEYPTDNERQIQAIIDDPGKYVPERVQALAYRALNELHLAAPPPTEVREDVKNRGLWGRLKWALTGK